MPVCFLCFCGSSSEKVYLFKARSGVFSTPMLIFIQSGTEVQQIIRVRNIIVPCRNGAFFASILKRTVGLRHDEKMGSGTLPPALNGSFSCFFDPFLGPRLQNLESKNWDKYLRLLRLSTDGVLRRSNTCVLSIIHMRRRQKRRLEREKYGEMGRN